MEGNHIGKERNIHIFVGQIVRDCIYIPFMLTVFVWLRDGRHCAR